VIRRLIAAYPCTAKRARHTPPAFAELRTREREVLALVTTELDPPTAHPQQAVPRDRAQLALIAYQAGIASAR